MSRWPFWVLTCLTLCGCQVAARVVAPASLDPCPSFGPCDDWDVESWLPSASTPRQRVIHAENQPIWPGCPTTLQVMARLHPIVFEAVRPDAEPDDGPPDPSDYYCEPPEKPLRRAGWRPPQNLAVR